MELLERESPLEQMSAAVRTAAGGGGSVVAVLGEAGIGKTSLVLEAISDAPPGVRVLKAGCEALFTPRPLGPLYDVAPLLGSDVDELLASSASRERLFPLVLSALRQEPTILVVEDVHWADRPTLDLLKYLSRRLSESPVLLVITYRDDEVGAGHPLISLLGDISGAGLRRLRLPRLSASAVETLAARSQRHLPDLYRQTGGNPFYVTEVLSSEEEGVPPTVRDAVLARAAKLSAGAREVLELASLIPGRAELSLIRNARGSDAAALEEAFTSGIAQLEGDTVVFRHELTRRAIEASISELRRIPMHGRILELLVADGRASLARLAHHAAGARDPQAILRFAPMAGAEAAAADAHREAAAHYRNAVAHAERLAPADRASLLETLSYECYLTEQAEEALVHRRAAFDIRRKLRDLLRQGDNLRWQSRLLWFLGRASEARECSGRAIAILERLTPGPELAMAWSNQSQLEMLAQNVDEAVLWGERAIELATQLGEQAIVVHALNNVGTAELLAGKPAGAEKLESSLRVSLEKGFREHAARAYCNIATEAVRELHYEHARRYIDEGITFCADHDLDAWGVYLMAWKARLLLEQGSWPEAADCALSVIGHHGVAAISRIPALAVLGRVRARRNDPGADETLGEAMRLAAATEEFQRVVPVVCARAEAAWLRADLESVADDVAAAYATSEHVCEPWARGELALWMWRCGRIATPPSGIPEAYRLQIVGRLQEAAEQFEIEGRPYEAAVALSDSTAAVELERAASILEKLGDGSLLPQVRQKLRASGGRVGRGPRRSTQENPHGLTSRQLEILDLLERGMRNSEIAERLCVSPKTVDHHVSSILGKLGVRTRGEAASLLRRQGTATSQK